MSLLKTPITGGDEIPKSVPWKDTEVTRVLHSAINATSFTCYIFCISQSPENGGETWCTTKFAE